MREAVVTQLRFVGSLLAKLYLALVQQITGMPSCLCLLSSVFCLLLYFPIQKVEKIRFKISSAVVAPVMASTGRSAA